MQTRAGYDEIVATYKQLHGIPEGVMTREPDLPMGMLCSQMITKILEKEYPPTAT